MGSNTLNSVSSGAITTALLNQYFTALGGDLLPRQVVGSNAQPADDVSKLGSSVYQWSELHVGDLFIDGALFNPDSVGTDTNWAIVTGATRSGSGHPDFLRASGSGATATLLATTTNLQITADGTSATISSDISITSLTTAPGTNNTCDVDDTSLTDQESSKYTGEDVNDPLTLDAVGTEVSDRVGQYICLKTPDGEYLIGYLEDATTLRRCYRGFFFDSSGNPVERGTLADNDTLTLMSLGWVFVDNNSSTIDVTYTTPVYSYDEPASPVVDDYWFDLEVRKWKRFDGSVWQEVDRIPVGLVVIDGTNCVASRSFDFTKSYSDHNSIDVVVFDDENIYSSTGFNRVSVYAQTHELEAAPVVWDITADLESGLTEASDTTYYLYVTELAQTIISDQKPYDRRHDLRGYYHPYHSWRCVGSVVNNGSSNFASAEKIISELFDVQIFTSSGTWTKPAGVQKVEVIVVGGGGGGGGADSSGGNVGAGAGGGGGGSSIAYLNSSEVGITETVTVGSGGSGGSSSGGGGGSGGNSSFGSHATGAGGSGGNGKDGNGITAGINAGNGGSGSVGDINIKGSPGQAGFVLYSTNEFTCAGAGGGSLYGSGGRGISTVSALNSGNSGGSYGGGGGGATANVNAGRSGGAGADGIVVVISR